MSRYVYFARVIGTDGPIKIGCSSCPGARCDQLASDVGAPIEVIAEAPGDYLLERNLHLKFAAHRADGPTRPNRPNVPGSTEWFEAVPGLLRLIDATKTTGKIVLPLEQCRERVIAARYKAGETLQQIGDSLGITRERVRQILNSVGVPRRSAAERAYIASLARRARWEAYLRQRQAA